jgi:phospholipid transport system substrate-binding protein
MKFEGEPMKSLRIVIPALVAVLSWLPTPARAGEPTEQLSATIKEFVTILASTPVSQLRATGLPEKARQLVFARFDFSEMTERSLGSHWRSLSPGEKREFVEAFTQRLLVSYGRTVRSSNRETIHFGREIRDGKQATVETKISGGNGDDLSIDYRLHEINGQWKVYDVLIDYVSMVQNYRAQFERVIAKSSLHELLRRIKNQES